MSKETDYLFGMYRKYAPTKMVGTYKCNTDESNKWLDNLIIAKKKIEALEIIIKKGVDVDWLIYNFKFGSLDDYNCDFGLYKEDNWRILTQEEYELLKEALNYGE